MIHLLIHLFSLFHHGRAQQTLFPFAVPLVVRSPYLNCWGLLGFSDGYGIVTTTFPSVYLNRSDWDPSLEVCYFLARRNTKTDCTSEI